MIGRELMDIPKNLPLPVRSDEQGILRVGDTQIKLEDVFSAYQVGYTPERIKAQFPMLKLADIYTLIGYYLNNKDEADAYVQEREAETERLWSPREELFEKFGQRLIEWVRDNQIHFADAFLDQTAPFSDPYKNELNGLTPAQIEMLKKMVVHWIDGTIHDFLYVLEDANWIHVRLEGEGIVLEDLRRAARGDLQGYIFIWAEKYSTKRLQDI